MKFILIMSWCISGPVGDVCRSNVAPIYFGANQDCVAAQPVAMDALMGLMPEGVDLIWFSLDCKMVRRSDV